jgi:hypothetical protein
MLSSFCIHVRRATLLTFPLHLQLSGLLNLPILGCATEVAQELQHHRNMTRVLANADVPMVDHVILDPASSCRDQAGEAVTDAEWLWAPLANLILWHQGYEWWEILLDVDPAAERRAACCCDKTRLETFGFINEQRRLYADEWEEGSRVQVSLPQAGQKKQQSPRLEMLTDTSSLLSYALQAARCSSHPPHFLSFAPSFLPLFSTPFLATGPGAAPPNPRASFRFRETRNFHRASAANMARVSP